MSALREILAKFGVDVDTKKLFDADKAINALAGNLREVGGLFLGSKLIDGIKGMVQEMTDLEGHITDTSAQLDISTGAFQRWELASKLAGASSEDFTASFRVLQKNIGAAANGNAQALQSFGQLGVKIRDEKGNIRDSADIYRDVGLAISKMPSQAQRTAALMDLLGKGGAKLGPLFSKGAEGLEQYLGAIDDVGGPIGEEALATIGETGDEIDKFEFGMRGLKATLAAQFFPVLTDTIKRFTSFARQMAQASKGTNVLKAALIILGIAAARQALLLYIRYLPFILLLALAILFLDDLITFIQGGDSVIGDFLDKLLGAGAGADIAKAIRKDWKDLNKEMAKSPDVAGKIEIAFKKVGKSIMSFFENDLPQAWQTFWEKMNEENKTGGTTFSDFWKKALSDTATRMKDGAKDLVIALLEGLKKNLDDAVDTVTKYIVDFLDKGIKAVSGALLGDEDALPSVTSGAVNDANDAATRAGNALRGAGGYLKNKLQSSPLSGLLGSANSVHVNNTIESIEIRTDKQNAAGILQAARQGASQGLSDSNRATLAAVETLA